MRSKVAKRILDETPYHIRLKVKYMTLFFLKRLRRRKLIITCSSSICAMASCATIEEMKPCDCVEQYWEYVAPKEYQLKDWTEIQCTTPVSIEQAAAVQSPGSNLVTIKCH